MRDIGLFEELGEKRKTKLSKPAWHSKQEFCSEIWETHFLIVG